MSNDMNILSQQAEDTGFLEDVVAVLKAFGIDDKDAWLIASSISAWSSCACGI